MMRYDRAERRKIMGYELSLDLLIDIKPVIVGSVDQLCEYIPVCHSPCIRKEAQSCSQYPDLYQKWKELQ